MDSLTVSMRFLYDLVDGETRLRNTGGLSIGFIRSRSRTLIPTMVGGIGHPGAALHGVHYLYFILARFRTEPRNGW